jgi:hypothetical protein
VTEEAGKMKQLQPKYTGIIQKVISRRRFLQGTMAGAFFAILKPLRSIANSALPPNPLFWVQDVLDQPFYGGGGGNYHAGIDHLLHMMGNSGLKFYRSESETDLGGPSGMIRTDDVVLIKVNGQWKYRGCTNSDIIRGLIQRILDHPDGFTGEVVIFENGQGRGSLNCDTTWSGYPDAGVHANANDESHSFLYLVNTVFNAPRVSSFLLDPIRSTFISASDHVTNGYRVYENISYPCFTTAGGNRVELREGIWRAGSYSQNIRLINVPVLKYHDTGGSEITASLKHLYGVVSMADGQGGFRHYTGLGETCGKMMASVRTPVLNIIDAIWVSHSSLSGYPANTTFRANQLIASQDPVALDFWAAKYILYPVSGNYRHLPTFSNIANWLTSARDTINSRGGLYDYDSGILVSTVTGNENDMSTESIQARFADIDPDFWAYSSVCGLHAEWITKGYPDGTFRPAESVNRAQMAAFIVKARYGEFFSYSPTPHFSDVTAGHWAFRYIQKMYDEGITAGYPDGTYRPSENVSRAQMAVFIISSKFPGTFPYNHTPHFSDVTADHWAFRYIQKMYDEGISTGYADGTYRPSQNVSRAQMATFIARAFLGMQ